MERRVYFYKITNLINNKTYIGQSVNPEGRWKNHKFSAKNNYRSQYLHRAMSKDGIENFHFEIISSSIVQDKILIDLEEENIIQQWNSRFFAEGYNVRPGGSTRGKWNHSIETRKKLSQQWKLVHSPESIKKVASANKGRTMPESQRRRISQANKGRKFSLGYKYSKETIAKRVAGFNKSYGDKRCNAPGCERVDGHKLNGVRYCRMHLRRIFKRGTLEATIRVGSNKGRSLSPETKSKLSAALRGRVAHNKGVPMSEAHKEKLRQLSLGREPPNKVYFTDEQIYNILTDSRGGKKIAKDFGVTYPVIKRIRCSYKIIEQNKIELIKTTNQKVSM